MDALEARRRQLGEFIRGEREARGYRSQSAFAEAVGFSPRQITAVERGEHVGRKTLNAIERMLKMQPDAAGKFLTTGDTALLATTEEHAAPEGRYPDGLRDEVERQLWDITAPGWSDGDRWDQIYIYRAKQMGRQEQRMREEFGDSTRTEQPG